MMVRFVEPTRHQEMGWKLWVASRPSAVRAVAERFDPWSLYLLKSSGHRVSVVSFSETAHGSVTLTVVVSGQFNAVIMERQVFGVDPLDLVPCELPAADEVVGSILSPGEVEDNIDALRVMARPDLWVMGDDGKATRRN